MSAPASQSSRTESGRPDFNHRGFSKINPFRELLRRKAAKAEYGLDFNDIDGVVALTDTTDSYNPQTIRLYGNYFFEKGSYGLGAIGSVLMYEEKFIHPSKHSGLLLSRAGDYVYRALDETFRNAPDGVGFEQYRGTYVIGNSHDYEALPEGIRDCHLPETLYWVRDVREDNTRNWVTAKHTAWTQGEILDWIFGWSEYKNRSWQVKP